MRIHTSMRRGAVSTVSYYAAGAQMLAQVPADLPPAQAALARIEEEYQRLYYEHLALHYARAPIGDLLGIGTSADSMLAMLQVIEDFMYRAIVLEKEALAGDVDAARRLRRASENILSSLLGVHVTADLVGNAAQAAADTVREAKNAATSGLKELDELVKLLTKAAPWVAGALAVVLALQLLSFVPRARGA